MNKYLPSLHVFIVTCVVILLNEMLGITSFIFAKLANVMPGTFPVLKG